MKKEINFRIIELPTHQVLLSKDFDNEEEDSKPLLVITIFCDCVKFNNKLGYEDEEKRNDVFDKFTEKQAEAFLKGVLELLE